MQNYRSFIELSARIAFICFQSCSIDSIKFTIAFKEGSFLKSKKQHGCEKDTSFNLSSYHMLDRILVGTSGRPFHLFYTDVNDIFRKNLWRSVVSHYNALVQRHCQKMVRKVPFDLKEFECS